MKIQNDEITIEQEIIPFFNAIVYNLEKRLENSFLEIVVYRGVDDILDNVTGLVFYNDQKQQIYGMNLVELDCNNNYIQLTNSLLDKITNYYQELNFQLKITNNLK